MEHSNSPAIAAVLVMLVLASVFVWVRVFQRRRLGLPLVACEPHAVVPWSGWDLLIVGLLAILLELVAGVFATEFNGAPLNGFSLVAVAASSASRMIWMACALVYLVARGGATADDLGLDNRKLGPDLVLGIELFLASLVPVYGTFAFVTAGLGWKSEHPLTKIALDEPSVGVLCVATLLAVVVAPLAEEFFFRVLLQGWLERVEIKWRQRADDDRQSDAGPPEPGYAPVVVAALPFALLHSAHGPDPIPLFILGLFLGYAYRQTHRIIAPVAIHAMFNGVTMLQLWGVFLASE